MTFICLFVVLAALFITVLNSRTVERYSTSENALSQLHKPSALDLAQLQNQKKAAKNIAEEAALSI